MKYVLLSFAIAATPAAAQQRKPAIPQPTTPAAVVSGTYGPALPAERRDVPERRAARSDTTEILEVVARKLSAKARDVRSSNVIIQSDTAWVSVMDLKFQRAIYRVERHHSWKVVDQPGR